MYWEEALRSVLVVVAAADFVVGADSLDGPHSSVEQLGMRVEIEHTQGKQQCRQQRQQHCSERLCQCWTLSFLNFFSVQYKFFVLIRH